MANVNQSGMNTPSKTALPAPGLIGGRISKKSRVPEAETTPVDFFAEFANLPVKDSTDLFTDPQEQYDEDLQEYTSGEILGRPGESGADFDIQFRNNFFRYSQDYQDRAGGAPGIDQDYGTSAPDAGRSRTEGSMDDRIHEEILDLFTRDRSLAADDVTAEVEDGLVTLTGTAVDAEMRAAIEEAVQTVPGVESVENRLMLG